MNRLHCHINSDIRNAYPFAYVRLLWCQMETKFENLDNGDQEETRITETFFSAVILTYIYALWLQFNNNGNKQQQTLKCKR